ncbi:MAG: FAD binding domain-containing protein [Candidatus Cloacimonetes bacterium]|jgi:CO/xanthine dehydrogenase FAD-binding subunit|nr:FAD binding domain-containing protein [Candidatus Cloacimonadota bacterium]
MRFEKFVQPENLKTALDILKKDSNSVILGGTTFLRLSDNRYSTGIDLSNLKLDFIKENDHQIEIGAYTSLRTIETDPVINKYFGNLLPKSLENLIGIQFRNNATIGGAIFSRLGFSEIITALLVLDCELEFEENGKIAFNKFISNWNIKRDILTKIIIKKKKGKSSYKMLRNSSADFTILSVAVSNFDSIKIAVGTRPSIAKLSQKAAQLKISDNSKIDEAAKLIAKEFNFGDDLRAKSDYRKKIAPVIVRRALQEVLK